METIDLHERALRAATAVVAGVRPADLDRPTPCAGWDLRALLAHCIGQNHGFAAVLESDHPRVAVEEFAPRPVEPGAWTASAARVHAAFRAAAAQRVVLLPELRRSVPAATALSMHLLDTVVHTWDVAAALGRSHRPADDLVAAVAAAAGRVPAGATRREAGAAFGPARPEPPGTDPWAGALAQLGRDPLRDEP